MYNLVQIHNLNKYLKFVVILNNNLRVSSTHIQLPTGNYHMVTNKTLKVPHPQDFFPIYPPPSHLVFPGMPVSNGER